VGQLSQDSDGPIEVSNQCARRTEHDLSKTEHPDGPVRKRRFGEQDRPRFGDRGVGDAQAERRIASQSGVPRRQTFHTQRAQAPDQIRRLDRNFRRKHQVAVTPILGDSAQMGCRLPNIRRGFNANAKCR